MAKRRRTVRASSSQTSLITKQGVTPWYRRIWILLSILGAGLFGLVANGPMLLENAEKLPSTVDRVSGKFMSWYYEDKSWEGFWSANPEEYVNIEEVNLSDVDIKIHLKADKGRLDGEISTKKICSVTPMFDYLLLEGEAHGKEATITVYDFIDGRRHNFFQFTAQKEGVVLSIAMKEGAKDWIPFPARLGLHSSAGDPYALLEGTCSKERKELLAKLKPKR
jgi:hypothetical protein